MKNRNLYNEGFYHIYNRGVDKRIIFQDENDRSKFLSYLVALNTDALIRIHAYCLMDNHFHLLIEQVKDEGVWRFMQKIGTGYTMYFNKKYERKGRLFESNYQSVEVSSHAQYLHISRYIHLNPLNILLPKWKELGVKDVERADRFLRSYKWSSYKAYMGEYSLIINPEKILREFTSNADYSDFVKQWMVLPGGG